MHTHIYVLNILFFCVVQNCWWSGVVLVLCVCVMHCNSVRSIGQYYCGVHYYSYMWLLNMLNVTDAYDSFCFAWHSHLFTMHSLLCNHSMFALNTTEHQQDEKNRFEVTFFSLLVPSFLIIIMQHIYIYIYVCLVIFFLFFCSRRITHNCVCINTDRHVSRNVLNSEEFIFHFHFVFNAIWVWICAWIACMKLFNWHINFHSRKMYGIGIDE